MPAIAAVTLNDGAATPVAHTFNPVGINQVGVAELADRSGGIPVGYPVLSVSTRKPVGQSRNYKIVVKITMPVLDVTSPSTGTGIQPAPSVAHVPLGQVEFVFHERSLLQDRKNVLAFMKNAMANALVTSLVENLEAVY